MDMIVERVMCGLPPSRTHPAAWQRYSPACGMRARISTSSLPGGRRINPAPGSCFVTPLRGDREISAAATLGFNVNEQSPVACASRETTNRELLHN